MMLYTVIRRPTLYSEVYRGESRAAGVTVVCCLLQILFATSCDSSKGGHPSERSAPSHLSKGPLFPPKRFAPTVFRTGNSLEGYRNAEKGGVKFVESDFRLSGDGVLMSAHDINTGGDCGRVDQKTIEQLKNCRIKNNNHLATLKDFLELAMEGWFLDLKDTGTKISSIQKRTIEAAMAEVEKAKLKEKVVLMVYGVPDASADALRIGGFRVGFKGYPKNEEQIMSLVKNASDNCFEMVCVKISNITPKVIDLSARKGVWHLAWDLGLNEKQWQELARFGLGGVITRHYFIAEKEVSAHYKPPKNWTPSECKKRRPVSKIN